MRKVTPLDIDVAVDIKYHKPKFKLFIKDATYQLMFYSRKAKHENYFLTNKAKWKSEASILKKHSYSSILVS